MQINAEIANAVQTCAAQGKAPMMDHLPTSRLVSDLLRQGNLELLDRTLYMLEQVNGGNVLFTECLRTVLGAG